MGKRKDFTGLRQGMLTVLEPLPPENGVYYWLCQCDCGNVKKIRSYAIARGQQSCGCMRGTNFQGVPQHDESNIGRRFNMLTIVGYAGRHEKSREALWLCQCDCGNTVIKTMHALQKGNPSCGCFLNENGHKPFRYEIGEKVKTKHGSFVIKSRFRKLKKNSSSHEKYYECECMRCHEKTVILENVLVRGSGSCYACSETRSYPAKFVYWFLKQLDIEFDTEYSPEWSGRCRYDFSFEIDGKRYLLEVDGLDHYNEKTRNEKTFDAVLEADRIKDTMAVEHGCELIRLDCRFSNKNYIIESIKKSPLSDLFDISNIDWNKCLEAWSK